MRTEKDFLGEREVPADVYWGVQTSRAVENFPISGLKAHPEFVRAMAFIKKAAATENAGADRLDRKLADAIVKAAEEVIGGKHMGQFVVDVYQAGAGTSFHMNMNEVLANRAAELLGGKRGAYDIVHPNDHVNMGQSTNDVFPTSMRIAALMLLSRLLPVLDELADAFADKADEFKAVVKSGRTHLQDATPITLGQEFGGYADAIRRCRRHLESSADHLRDLGIGGSAVGTGVMTHPGYRQNVVKKLGELLGIELRPSPNTFEAMQSNAPFAMVSSALKTLALELIRIANDLRLLSSGPKTGLGEIDLPTTQPGSSIMPGKVNPVMAEVLDMVCFQVVGNDLTIALAVQAGQMELNVMMPVIHFNLLQSIEVLTNCLRAFIDRCATGITANADLCRQHAMKSVGLATLLRPVIGYHASAEVAQEAVETGKSIGELAIEKGLLTKEQVDELLRPEKLSPDR
ncbi:MAG: aspartate ammonia-lyase [Planctomycetes bacterium]|nr:aspartate ammonia-lyase [Planctomycetota bacterium]